MIRFGPAGNSQSFYNEGHKSTLEAPEWLDSMGLNAFEYSFGRGVNIRTETAEAISKEMKKYNIAISCHAPYYINFASLDDQAILNSVSYVERSVKGINSLGGNRCIIHSGSQSKTLTRDEALLNVSKSYESLINYLDEKKYDYILCPEAMGKFSQIGTYTEIIDLCKISEKMIPCIDFGHVNCIMQGGLKNYEDYKKIIDYALSNLGERAKYMHIHFSKIQFGNKGELRHLNFRDTGYGPEFEPLAKIIAEYKLEPVIICESAGMMAEDALVMKKLYENIVLDI